MTKVITLGLMVACITACRSPSSESASHFVSPSGQYTAEIIQDDGATEERTLEFRSVDSGTIKLRRPITRGAEVVWSSESDLAAIIDQFASNENRIELVSLESGRSLLTISRDDAPTGVNAIPMPGEYSHVYFVDVKWLNPNKIRLSVEMYNSLSTTVPKTFEGSYEVAIDSGRIR